MRDAWTFYSAGHTNVVCGATDVADFKLVKRVLLTSDTIDCEAFGGCEIYRVKFPVGQSAQADLQVTATSDEITITTEWRRYRVRGLERSTLFVLAVRLASSASTSWCMTVVAARANHTYCS